MKDLVTTDLNKNLISMDTPTNYIPSIKLTYSSSEQFIQQKAKVGDFYYNNELTLGSSIKATALAYRYQVIAIDRESREFNGSLILGEHETPFREREEYVKFCQEHIDDIVEDGIDILLFLPENNLFAVLFAKKKLLKGGLSILQKGSNGNIVLVKSILKNWKKLNWLILEVNVTGEKVEVPNIDEKLEIYNSQKAENITEENTEDERVR